MSKASPWEVAQICGEYIIEGAAKIPMPKGEVFYNPVQQFNRDLSICVISKYAENLMAEQRRKEQGGIVIFEGLSATGLRSIRYSKEISNISKIYSNDLDPNAVAKISENVLANCGPDSNIIPTQGDANAVLHRLFNEGNQPDVIDLDPYGSAAPFIDTAVQKIRSGGLLCVTCTDLAVLCATYQETCFAKYGGLPLRGSNCHEAALRLVLNSIESSANQYKKHVIPLLSCSIDFYVRLFVLIVESPAGAKLSSTKRGIVTRCVKCQTITPRPFMHFTGTSFKKNDSPLEGSCQLCGHRLEMCGPMWLEKIHDSSFASSLLTYLENSDYVKLATYPRVKGLLSLIRDELPNPFFQSLPEMSSIMKCSVPKLESMRSALLNAGYSVSVSHTCPNSIKTNAPSLFLWRCLFELFKDRVANNSNDLEMLIRNIMNEKEPSFEPHPLAEIRREKGLKRYPANPTKNWGPLSKAKKQQQSKLE